MKKIALLAVILILLPIMVFAGGDNKLPLCQFFSLPYFQTSYYIPTLFVMYDGRFYDRHYFAPSQAPNGGIKIAIELGTWPTPQERDAVTDKIKSVTFTNITKNQEFQLEEPDKYLYTPANSSTHYNSADFYFWLGNAYNAVGSWEVTLVFEQPNISGKGVKTKYVAEFDITNEFLQQLATEPVSDITVEIVAKNPPPGNSYTVCYHPASLTLPQGQPPVTYKIRITNQEGDLLYDTPSYTSPNNCWGNIPLDFAGLTGKVEARLTGKGIRLDKNCSWYPTWSRTNTYFKFPSANN
jgi:hypothetical protein